MDEQLECVYGTTLLLSIFSYGLNFDRLPLGHSYSVKVIENACLKERG